MTVDYLEALPKEGSREEFERVLARVPDVEPDPWDRWSTEDLARIDLKTRRNKGES